MSDIMLHGVLNMPPELWIGTPIDVMQRHSRYIQASEYIKELTEQRDRLAEALRELCETLLADKPRDITDLLNKAGDALASVEGGSHDH
jgi:N-glycosylase/DNA lyase